MGTLIRADRFQEPGGGLEGQVPVLGDQEMAGDLHGPGRRKVPGRGHPGGHAGSTEVAPVPGHSVSSAQDVAPEGIAGPVEQVPADQPVSGCAPPPQGPGPGGGVEGGVGRVLPRHLAGNRAWTNPHPLDHRADRWRRPPGGDGTEPRSWPGCHWTGGGRLRSIWAGGRRMGWEEGLDWHGGRMDPGGLPSEGNRVGEGFGQLGALHGGGHGERLPSGELTKEVGAPRPSSFLKVWMSWSLGDLGGHHELVAVLPGPGG